MDTYVPAGMRYCSAGASDTVIIGSSFFSAACSTRSPQPSGVDALADGADVEMPYQATFWSPGFASLIDRWGTPWMINCTAPVEEAAATAQERS